MSEDGIKSERQHTKVFKALSSPTKIGPARSDSCFDASECQRSSSAQTRSVLTESISKEFEIDQQTGENGEKFRKGFATNRSPISKTLADSFKKEESKRTKETCLENQDKSIRKMVAKMEDQMAAVQPSVSNKVKEILKSDSQASTALMSKDLQKKEPLKASAQAIKEKIGSFSAHRPRGTTVSAYPVSKAPYSGNDNRTPLADRSLNSPLNPYFVFLQFFYSPFISAGGTARPLLLNSGEVSKTFSYL